MCRLRGVWGALEGRTAAGVLDCSLGLLEKEVWGGGKFPGSYGGDQGGLRDGHRGNG